MITGHNLIEDDALQGLSVEAQLIYLRGMRRHVDFGSGLARVSFGLAKRVLEFIPDLSSNQPERRVMDVSNHFIRARFDELQRAGLCERKPSTIKGETPVFFLPLLATGSVRQKSEPTYEPTYEPIANIDRTQHGCGIPVGGTDMGTDGGTDSYQYKDKLINKPAREVPSGVPLGFGQIMDVLGEFISPHTLMTAHNRAVMRDIEERRVCRDELVDSARHSATVLAGGGFGPTYVLRVIERRRQAFGGGEDGTGRRSSGKRSVAEQAADIDERFG